MKALCLLNVFDVKYMGRVPLPFPGVSHDVNDEDICSEHSTSADFMDLSEASPERGQLLVRKCFYHPSVVNIMEPH